MPDVCRSGRLRTGDTRCARVRLTFDERRRPHFQQWERHVRLEIRLLCPLRSSIAAMSKKNKLSTRKRANEFTVRTEKTRATEMKLRQTKRAHNKQLLSELVQMTTSVKVNEHRDGPLLPPLGSSPMSEKPARGNGKVRKPRKQDVRRKNKIAQRMQNQKAMIK